MSQCAKIVEDHSTRKEVHHPEIFLSTCRHPNWFPHFSFFSIICKESCLSDSISILTIRFPRLTIECSPKNMSECQASRVKANARSCVH